MGQDTVTKEAKKHPSMNLESRRTGFGIGGGYERPRVEKKLERGKPAHRYGAICHGGYYGSGSGSRPFKIGQATFGNEVDWYKSQYCEETSDYTDSGRKRDRE